MAIVSRKPFSIDMWYGNRFVPKKYFADASFYPHGSFGYAYRGNIFDKNGKIIGDYGANDGNWIKEKFIV